MSRFATDPARAAAPNHRAQVLAEAVVSAYIDEIARSGRRQHRAASAPSRRATAPKPAAARSRAPSSPCGRTRSLTAATDPARHDDAHRGKLVEPPPARRRSIAWRAAQAHPSGTADPVLTHREHEPSSGDRATA
jgi:hypothetical protein